MAKTNTTRRGFLRTTVAATSAAATTGCADFTARSEASKTPAVAAGENACEVSVVTRVNGTKATVCVGSDTSALTVLREQLKITGPKLACGHGACGACVAVVDGKPVATCLLPATALHKKRVTTVEGLSPAGSDIAGLHPVQRAFAHHDALQCGYCTSGFVVEAKSFFDAWRERNGKKAPTRDDVASALCGHLCRCGAYASIYTAVIEACEGRFDSGTATVARVDALAKVTGAATYTVDVHRPKQLEGVVLRSPHAHAIVESMDWSKALALDGVEAAVDLVPSSRRVRYVGQEVVGIAAQTMELARKALALVEVRWKVEPHVVGIDAAMAASAAVVYPKRSQHKIVHPTNPDPDGPPNESEGPALGNHWHANVRGPLGLLSHRPGAARRGVKRGLGGEGVVYSGHFQTQSQAHTCLEPHAAIAEWTDGSHIQLHASTQAVRDVGEDVAQRFGVPEENVTVIAQHVGGAFGSKARLTLEIVAAVELSRAAGGRPVKVALSRHEEIQVGGYRPAVRVDVAIAASADGSKCEGIEATAYSDAGTAVGAASVNLVRLLYPQAPSRLRDFDVLNHAPPGCPFRGPGGPPALFAVEQAVDEIAHRSGADPLTLRQQWNKNPNRALVFDWAAAHPVWTGRRKPMSDKGRFRRGLGISTGVWLHFTSAAARIQIEASADGIVVSSATQDMGNGTRTLLADAVAGVLGVDPMTIKIDIGRSDYVAGPMSAGSRTASSLGPPAIEAAEQLRDELVEVAETELGLASAKAAPGGVAHGGGFTPWSEVLAHTPRLTFVVRRGRDKRGFMGPPIEGTSVGKYLAASLQMTEVEVDTRLGRVRVLETWAAYSVGRIYSPRLARSQAEGGIVQGFGYALFEDRTLTPSGHLLTANLEDYRIAGIGDIPPMHVEFVQGGFDNAKGKGIGLAELTTMTPASSVANGVFNATGWRPTQLPIRPDRVVKGLGA